MPKLQTVNRVVEAMLQRTQAHTQLIRLCLVLFTVSFCLQVRLPDHSCGQKRAIRDVPIVKSGVSTQLPLVSPSQDSVWPGYLIPKLHTAVPYLYS